MDPAEGCVIGVFRVGVVRDGMAFARSNLRPQRPSCRGAPALHLVNAVVAAFSIALLLEGGFRGLMPVIVRACSRTHCPYLHVYQQPRHRVNTFHSSFPICIRMSSLGTEWRQRIHGFISCGLRLLGTVLSGAVLGDQMATWEAP